MLSLFPLRGQQALVLLWAGTGDQSPDLSGPDTLICGMPPPSTLGLKNVSSNVSFSFEQGQWETL